MLKATLYTSITNEELTAVLPIYGAGKLLMACKSGDVVIYSHQDTEIKLVQRIHRLLNRTNQESVIHRMVYSLELNTVFAQCDHSIVLLNSTNLSQYDKIVDKRGIGKCWLMEGIGALGKTLTVLVYTVAHCSRVKLLIWRDRAFKEIEEINFNNRSEVMVSAVLHREKLLLATNYGVYYWGLRTKTLFQLNRVLSPKWPSDLHAAMEEFMLLENIAPGIIDDRISLNPSVLSKKSSFSTFFRGNRQAVNEFKQVRFVFKPHSCEKPIYVNGNAELSMEVSFKDLSLTTLHCAASRKFLENHRQFGHMQALCGDLLLIYNSDAFRIIDFRYGYNYLEQAVDVGIKEILKISENSIAVWTADNSVRIYKLTVEDQSDASFGQDFMQSVEEYEPSQPFKKIVLCKTLLSLDGTSLLCDVPDSDDSSYLLDLYALKLRDLTVLWSLRCLENCLDHHDTKNSESKETQRSRLLEELVVKKVFENFVEFLAPPELVISCCLPLELTSGFASAFHFRHDFGSDPQRRHIPGSQINRYCIPFLIEARRNLLNVHREGKTTWANSGRKIEIDCQFFQIDQQEEASADDLLTLVDTTIFKLYVEYSRSLVGPFTRVSNYCEHNFVVKELTKHQMYQELVDFYFYRGCHSDALALLRSLYDRLNDKDDLQELQTSIMTLIIHYLRKLPSEYLETILQNAAWLLKEFPSQKEEIITDIFLNYDFDRANVDQEKTYDFINGECSKMGLRYLEYVVDIHQCKNSVIYDTLIMRYLDDLHAPATMKKLLAILKTTVAYNAHNVLEMLRDKLTNDSLSADEIRQIKLMETFPMKLIGDHENALCIFLEDLSSYSLASSYCSDIYKSSPEAGKVLLWRFLDMILESTTSKPPHNLRQFFQEYGSVLDFVEFLRRIPTSLCLEGFERVLSHRLKFNAIQKNNSRLQKNLLQVDLINKAYEINEKQAAYVILSEETKCPVCNKSLKNNVEETYTISHKHGRDVVLHYGCGQSQQHRHAKNVQHPPKVHDFFDK
ncbi:LAMI_0A01904g1_1 [Lachancea mirantina]|uniref:LAMI_0A01904g1_1 n=1 Tax=Lachancea mirantina TaxID=1230905 RepID=A0A1G4IMP1_9SACH|nr:LAMI_0A01904g1_1 [Lachancea mirantina]